MKFIRLTVQKQPLLFRIDQIRGVQEVSGVYCAPWARAAIYSVGLPDSTWTYVDQDVAEIEYLLQESM